MGNGDSSTSDLRNRIRHLILIIVLGFFAIGVGMVYWAAIQAQTILVRDDNPRIVDKEIAIQRGSILSTNGEVLAETITDGAITKRIYANGGGPAVGYFSIRHGTSGVEESHDPILRGTSGDYWTDYWHYDLLNQPRFGQDIRLTLDERWQRAGDQLMGDQSGAVLMISLPEMAIRAMVSKPDYDPNFLDNDFDNLIGDFNAPLLNRVTQGQYQPGMTLQPFILAGALEQSLIELTDVVSEVNQRVRINGEYIECYGNIDGSSGWKEILEGACPGPNQDIAIDLGEEAMEQIFLDFGLTNAPQSNNPVDQVSETVIEDLLLSAVGYDRLIISPLELGLAFSVLGNEGKLIESQLVDAIQGISGEWHLPDGDQTVSSAISPETANAIRGLLPIDRGIAEFNTSVISGPESTNNSWYLALAPASDPLYAVVVVVENSDDPDDSKRVGRSLLRNVLAPKDS
jgi:peptidoglycan glycosyltransferase